MTEIQIPISPDIFWPGTIILALLAAIFVVYGVLARDTVETPWLDNAKRQMGLHVLNSGFVAVGIVLYTAIASLVFGGLCLLIWDTIRDGLLGASDNRNELFKILRVAGLTTVLGAIVALPVSLTRLRLTREQVKTTEDALFNDKIDAALEGLYSRRQVTERDEDGVPIKDVWQDDITRRNAAIDRLERLAGENISFAPDIARMLAIYVRELSKENRAQPHPDPADEKAFQSWQAALEKRTDMENATQTLGRLIKDQNLQSEQVDLRNTNLQGFDLRGLCFEQAQLNGAQLQGAYLEAAQLQGTYLARAQLQGADLEAAQLQGAYFAGAQLQGADLARAQLQGAYFSGAQLQGANLVGAQLQGAHLLWAQLQGADLTGAQLQGAHLSWAKLQGADLSEAQLQGADLSGAQLQGANLSLALFDAATSLTGAFFQGASVTEVDFTNVPQIADHLETLFGGMTTILPDGVPRPDHMTGEYYSDHITGEYYTHEDELTAWRAFQRSIGQDPDNPT